MSLFSLSDIETKNAPGDDDSPGEFIETFAGSEYMNAASLKFFKQRLATIEQNRHYHYSTGGQWNMHELLTYLLSITGPADVYITTWAITEEPVRSLMFLKETGVIRSVKCVFDHKVKEQKSKAFLLAESNFDIVHLAKCHAKVSLIVNDDWGVSISGSANYTRNPRVERGVICTQWQVAEFDRQWIEDLISGKQPFKVRGI